MNLCIRVYVLYEPDVNITINIVVLLSLAVLVILGSQFSFLIFWLPSKT